MTIGERENRASRMANRGRIHPDLLKPGCKITVIDRVYAFVHENQGPYRIGAPDVLHLLKQRKLAAENPAVLIAACHTATYGNVPDQSLAGHLWISCQPRGHSLSC